MLLAFGSTAAGGMGELSLARGGKAERKAEVGTCGSVGPPPLLTFGSGDSEGAWDAVAEGGGRILLGLRADSLEILCREETRPGVRRSIFCTSLRCSCNRAIRAFSRCRNRNATVMCLRNGVLKVSSG